MMFVTTSAHVFLMTAAIRRLCSNFVKPLDMVDKSHIALDLVLGSDD
jgi:hypothetical protein